MMKILLAIGAVFSMAAMASGNNSPDLVCQFKVPTVHQMQKDGAYIGRGKSVSEARSKAIAACHEDLELWTRDFPKNPCNEFSGQQGLMECSSLIGSKS